MAKPAALPKGMHHHPFNFKKAKVKEDLKQAFAKNLSSLLSIRLGATALRRKLRANTFIENDLTYSLYELLPKQQRKDFLDRLTVVTGALVYSQEFLNLLLLACFDRHGRPVPTATGLQHWLLKSVYANSYQQLYTDWLKCKGAPMCKTTQETELT